MANRKKSRAELEAELKMLRRQKGATAVASVLNSLIKWGALVAMTGYCYLSIETLAGKSTFADIGVFVLADLGISKGLSWLLAVLSVGYGLRQRSLRKRTVERLHARIRELERGYDPGRTSSGLSPRGDTHPEDA